MSLRSLAASWPSPKNCTSAGRPNGSPFAARPHQHIDEAGLEIGALAVSSHQAIGAPHRCRHRAARRARRLIAQADGLRLSCSGARGPQRLSARRPHHPSVLHRDPQALHQDLARRAGRHGDVAGDEFVGVGRGAARGQARHRLLHMPTPHPVLVTRTIVREPMLMAMSTCTAWPAAARCDSEFASDDLRPAAAAYVADLLRQHHRRLSVPPASARRSRRTSRATCSPSSVSSQSGRASLLATAHAGHRRVSWRRLQAHPRRSADQRGFRGGAPTTARRCWRGYCRHLTSLRSERDRPEVCQPVALGAALRAALGPALFPPPLRAKVTPCRFAALPAA